MHAQLRSGAFPFTGADLDSLLSACFKALDGSTYPLRKAIAQLVGYSLSSMLLVRERVAARARVAGWGLCCGVGQFCGLGPVLSDAACRDRARLRFADHQGGP